MFAAGLALLLLADALVRDLPAPRGDELIYERMAQDPSAPHTYVFAYRVAVPWLVHVLPFDHTLSFQLVAWLCSAAAGALLFALLDHFRFERRVTVPLALLFVVSPPLLVVGLRQGRNPDPATVLVMVAATLLIVQRRPRALALVLLAGAFVRESWVFLVPFAYAIWAQRWWDPRTAVRVLAVALPAALAYAALRAGLPTVGRDSVPGYGSLLGGRLDLLQEGVERGEETVRRLGTAFGPLWLVSMPAFLHWSFARRGTVLLGMCLVAFSFALDWGRIAFLAAPVVYAAAAWTLHRHPRLRAPTLAAWALVVVVYAVYMQLTGVDNIIDTRPPPYPVR